MVKKTIPVGFTVAGFLAHDVSQLNSIPDRKKFYMQANRLRLVQALSITIVSIFLMLISAQAYSHTLFIPRAYKVSGISAEDVLNVRAAPSARSTDLGDLHAGFAPVEILELDETGQWGRLTWQDTDGWVAMRYLEQVRLPTIGNTSLPVGLQCVGTEPFWSMSLETSNTLQLSLHPDTALDATVESAVSSINYLDFPVAIIANVDDLNITTIINPLTCNDGMSDKQYGWEVDVLTTTGNTSTLVSGCCSMPETSR